MSNKLIWEGGGRFLASKEIENFSLREESENIIIPKNSETIAHNILSHVHFTAPEGLLIIQAEDAPTYYKYGSSRYHPYVSLFVGSGVPTDKGYRSAIVVDAPWSNGPWYWASIVDHINDLVPLENYQVEFDSYLPENVGYANITLHYGEEIFRKYCFLSINYSDSSIEEIELDYCPEWIKFEDDFDCPRACGLADKIIKTLSK